jgi:2-hydroxychromene-2-carboxylate isomerase
MTRAIDFYFDFSSSHGYFASTRIDRLAAKYGRSVRWHPILLGVVFKTTGAQPLIASPIKAAYMYRDFDRTARFHGIPYKTPDVFPVATQFAARAMLWLKETQGEDKAVEFAKAVYRTYFVDGVNINEPENVASVASRLGLDAAALSEAATGAPMKERFKNEIEAAMARGVFGSPFVIVDDEPFWGLDHFDQIEAFLKNGKI